MRFDMGNMTVSTIFSLLLLVKSFFCKTLILLKRDIFCFTCPGKVKMWPKEVKSGIFEFKTSQNFRSSLLRSSIAISGQMGRGCPHPQLRSSMVNSRCWRGSRAKWREGGSVLVPLSNWRADKQVPNRRGLKCKSMETHFLSFHRNKKWVKK